MPRSLILVMLTAALLTVTTLVAAAAAAFFWGGTVGLASADRATSGLMAAIYGPFALLALLLPALAGPMARAVTRFAGGAATPLRLPVWLAWAALFAGAEALTVLVRALAGEPSVFPAPFFQAMLAVYAAVAVPILRRSQDHVPGPSIDAP